MEILIVLLLIVLNGFFALAEISLVSAKKHVIEEAANSGSKRAVIALKLIESPENFLSSVQVGITLIGIIAGAYGASKLVENLEPFIASISFFEEFSTEISFALIITFITYLSIVVGELIPKTFALSNPEKIALICAPFIHVFTRITYPLVRILSISTKLFLKLLPIEDSSRDRVSEEDLVQIIKLANTQGLIDKEEKKMHDNIRIFADQKASNLMTHRTDVQWINIDSTYDEIKSLIKNSRFSKFPICKNSIDEVVGVVTARDFFEKTSNYDDLLSIIREPIVISSYMPASDVLISFKNRKEYLSIVRDEHGSFEGILTLHDLVEAIVGNLPNEAAGEEENIVKRSDGSLLISGNTEVDDINDYFEIELITKSPKIYKTLAGFVIYFSGKIPEAGYSFEYNGHLFEVVDIDGHRIDKVLISKID